jgi:hypothetical protein
MMMRGDISVASIWCQAEAWDASARLRPDDSGLLCAAHVDSGGQNFTVANKA